MAITGLGGVGETPDCAELAYRIRDKKPECSIFWIPSTSVEKIEQAYMDINEHLRLQDMTPSKIKCSSELRERIIDNADDTNIWVTSNGSSPALKTYIPQSKYGFVLFMTRNRQLATKLVSPEVIDIPQMDDKITADLLKVSLIYKDLVNDRQGPKHYSTPTSAQLSAIGDHTSCKLH